MKPAPADLPVLSICMVTYKAREYLRACLHSLAENEPFCSYEVIIVDNHSQDGVLDMLRDEFPDVICEEMPGNLGYTRPMNVALQKARGRYLAQLNADTLALPGSFDELIRFMDSHPEAGICTPKVLNRDGTLQKQCRRSEARPWDVFCYFSGLAKLYPQSPRFGGYLQSFLPEDEVNPVQAVSGSCMLIRREVVAKIGYLDEAYFAFQEDTDFCLRARRAGWLVYYVPLARIVHYGGQSGSQVKPYHSVYQWHRSYYLYYRKHLAKDYIFLFNWFYYALMGVKLGLALISTFLRKEKYIGSKKP